MGSCGLSFPNGDAEALAEALRRALTDGEIGMKLRENAAVHLRRHSSLFIGDAYLALFEKVLAKEGMVVS